MARQPKILAFAGSARKDSTNKKLIKIAAAGAREAGAEVTLIDLNDYPMPLYNGDLEENEGQPENAKKIKKLMLEHDAFLISSPEYNSSISPLLKNTIDWISRPVKGEEDLIAFRNKAVALISASPGPLGGLRGLVTVRSILGNIFAHVIPQQMTLPSAYEAFDDQGNLKDPAKEKRAKEVGAALVKFTSKMIQS